MDLVLCYKSKTLGIRKRIIKHPMFEDSLDTHEEYLERMIRELKKELKKERTRQW